MKKLLRNAVVLLMLVCLTASYAIEANAEELLILSEMTSSEQIAFLEENGVTVPGGEENYNYWTPFIDECIKIVENDPAYIFRYNWNVSQNFAIAIQKAVNSYYGVTPNFGAKIQSRAITSLKYSEVLGEWDPAFNQYNCYAFAIDRTDFSYAPGDFSGNDLPNRLTLETVARYVIEDLKSNAFGYTCVQLSRTEENAVIVNGTICVRLSESLTDYHFMKKSKLEWHHKPGPNHILKYLYSDVSTQEWTDESMDEFGGIVGGSVNYTGEIYYFTPQSSHSYNGTIRYTGEHYHSGAFHVYSVQRYCQWCESYVDGTLKEPCSGPPCNVHINTVGNSIY